MSNYSLGDMIGQGSFGKVMMGLNKDNGQIMAVKQVPLISFVNKEMNKSDKRVNAIKREISLLSMLEHKNIVRYLGHSL